jgi:hypothetical protein
MISNYRDQKIPAYNGHIPNAPVLNSSELRVVQINTQINAAIDTTDVKNTAAEIQSVKSQIASLKQTIASQKSEAQGISEQYAYNALQQQIATNVNDLNNLQTTYSTLVSSFQAIVRENSAVTTPPKYHIRGFFPIPEYKYRDANQTIPEEIVGFDIAYRYIKEDSTATQLNTFTYTASDGSEHTGTFTDWNIEQGPLKTKILDSTDGKFVWKSENIADGTETNINQIDIAISKGEKVEIKARSISECGYPYNPLRSDWSESIIIEFPPTLATGNQIADLIEEINSDALTLTVQNNLDSLGVTDHLKDSVANKNSVNGMYFKHLAENIAYELTTTDTSGNVVINSISVQRRLDDIYSSLSDISGTVDINRATLASIQEIIDRKTAEYDENILNISTGLIETSNGLNSVSTGLRQILSLDRDADGNYHPKVFAEKYTLKNTSGQSKSYISLDDTGTSPDVWFREETGGNAVVHTGNVILEKSEDEKVNVIQKFVDIDASLILKASNASLTELAGVVANVSTAVVDTTTKLENVSTAVDRNTTFIDDISTNDGKGLKSAGFYVTNNGTPQIKLVYDNGALNVTQPNGEDSMTVNVKDVEFQVNDGTGGRQTQTLGVVYTQVSNISIGLGTLRQEFDDTKNNVLSFVKTENGAINTNVNNSVVNSDLTVKGDANISKLVLQQQDFMPVYNGTAVNAYFLDMFLDGESVKEQLNDRVTTKEFETVDNFVKSLSGDESVSEKFSVEGSHAQFDELMAKTVNIYDTCDITAEKGDNESILRISTSQASGATGGEAVLKVKKIEVENANVIDTLKANTIEVTNITFKQGTTIKASQYYIGTTVDGKEDYMDLAQYIKLLVLGEINNE